MEFRQHTTVSKEELFLGEELNIEPFKNRKLTAHFSCFSEKHITSIWMLLDRIFAAS